MLSSTITQVGHQSPTTTTSQSHIINKPILPQQISGTDELDTERQRHTSPPKTNIRQSRECFTQSPVPVAPITSRLTSILEGDGSEGGSGDSNATWATVAKRRRQVVNGTGTAETAQQHVGRLKVVQPTTKIFVSRLDPATTETELTEYVKDAVDVTPTSCTKLKSKYDTYSSFVLVVPVDEKDKILDGSKWMVGTLIKPFVNKPKKQTQNI